MSYNNQAEIDAALQSCLAILDDKAAMDCAIQVGAAVPKENNLCAPRFVLLTQEGCAPCEEERQAKQEALTHGDIEEVSMSSDRGQRIVVNTGVDFTPAVLLLDCTDHLIEPVTSEPSQNLSTDSV